MEISKRLQAVADLVSYPVMADIGTDHGYVPIYLHKLGRITKAFACDVAEGPLEKAKENIGRFQGTDIIETRLGSGLTPLHEGEVQSAVIAGMGGMLVIRILRESLSVVNCLEELILSPQLDIDQVRRYVHEIGFTIHTERMVLEEGKVYTILRCVHGEERYEREIEYLYGKKLIEQKEPLLEELVSKELNKYTEVRSHLLGSDTEGSQKRLAEVEEKMGYMREALLCLLR